jgi:Cu(I)/Ag(I) efflux system membrane protein CusA/SilA
MWSTQTGAEVMKPLAAPVIGGMLSSLIHILIITPVIFTWLHSRKLRLDLINESPTHRPDGEARLTFKIR